MPRVFELIDLIEDRNAPSAYFQKNFECGFRSEVQRRDAWLAREAELRKLSDEAWRSLKEKAHRYLVVRDQKRGWEQLISILNEARGYAFLQGIGCSVIKFIAENDKSSPDFEGEVDGRCVLCEVKTIQASDEEVGVRSGKGVRIISSKLTPEFFKKLASDLCNAKKQMAAYGGEANARQVAYIIINFDDWLAEYKAQYYRQIDDYLCGNPVQGIEIVFHNQKTAFHTQITMKSATVINE